MTKISIKNYKYHNISSCIEASSQSWTSDLDINISETDCDDFDYTISQKNDIQIADQSINK